MVGERYTTGALNNTLAPNFHHVINPDDVIPFPTSELKSWTRQLLDLLKNNSNNIAAASAGLLGIPQDLRGGLLQLVTIMVNSGVGEFRALWSTLSAGLKGFQSHLPASHFETGSSNNTGTFWIPQIPRNGALRALHAPRHTASNSGLGSWSLWPN